MNVSFIHLRHVPIFEQLQLEEALLRNHQENIVLINSGSPAAIVMGISGKVETLVHQEICSLPIIRRFSGGGTVVVDEQTLFVTFILNKKDFPLSPFPEHLMSWSEAFYKPLFAPHPFALKENDYVIQEKKIGGNAQYFHRERMVHHSTFLFDFNPEYMNLLKYPPKTPSYRQGRSHLEFLSPLKTFSLDIPSFKTNFIDYLSKTFEVKELLLEECEPFLNQTHRKSVSLV